MKPLTDPQKKAAWIICLILIAVHFAPAVFHSIALAFSRKQPIVAPPVKPSPYVPMQTVVAVPVNTPQNLFSPEIQGTFLGIWQGSQFMPNGDHCNVRLELRLDSVEPGKVSGYDSRTCIGSELAKGGTMSPAAMDQFRKDTSPVSTAMTGSLVNGDLVFRVDKTLGSAPDQCPMTSYAVSQFGQKGIAAQWQEGACPAGQMVLSRVGG